MSNLKNVVKLSDIAEVRTGFTFREKVEELQTGNAYIVQIKDARSLRDQTYSQSLYSDDLPRINMPTKINAPLNIGSVLLPSRGEYYRAFYFLGRKDKSLDLPVIASSQFLILSPKTEELLPEYLCWYLNQPMTQHELNNKSQGSNIPMLTVTKVSSLEIELPSLEKQKQIIQLNYIWEQEQALTQKLLQNREQMMQGMFQQLLKGNK
ncbi:restriction endonuclease subunit S [Acinetobacter oleivorans]|uniref:restriction endonuclease subunit S n=1 Tax=Acinetobacter oleivorans TaxID=1148157 RepID=UPI0030192D5A